MKNIKNWLIALAFALSPLSANAQMYGPTNSTGSVSGASIVGTGGTTETLPTVTDTLLGVVTNLRPIFTSSTQINPIQMTYFQDVSFGSSSGPNASQTVIVPAVSGRTIFPSGAGFSIATKASGAQAPTQGLIIGCTPSGNLIATIPAAILGLSVSGTTPITAFTSSSGSAPGIAGGIVLASAFTRGCAANDSVFISTNSSQGLGPTTDLFVNFPYVLQ